MAPASWLFVNGSESIRIVRPHGCSLIILGPAQSRQVREFRDEDEMQGYQMSLAEQLSERGFLLLGEDIDRRSGQDRRGARRSQADRRAEAMALMQ